MKKSIVLAAVFGLIFLWGAVPGLILERTERYQVMSPRVEVYQPSISCEGTVEAAEGYDLLVSGNYQVRERYVSVGDRVKEGQVLAVLEKDIQEPVMYLQTQGRGFSQEDDIAALMEEYGLSGASADSILRMLEVSEDNDNEEEIQVTAPVAGIITREIPVPGSLVRSGSTLCSVQGTGEYFALVTVSEKNASKISPGDEVVLTGEGVGGSSCTGVVSQIYPGTRKEISGTTAQNVVDIEVSIPKEAGEIRPGYSVKAQIFTDIQRQLLVLPYESVGQDQENREYVFVAGENGLEKRFITTGTELSDGVEVVEGISPEELVAVPQGETGTNQVTGRYLLESEK